MAISATLERVPWASNRTFLRTEVPVDLDDTGSGSTEVMLDGVFKNEPEIIVVPPAGGANSYYTGFSLTVEYQASYDSAVPSITVSVVTEPNTQFHDKTVTVLLLAADRA